MNTSALPAAPASDSSTSLSGLVRLSEWGLIRAQGEDAGTFLQGQLTQDVLSLRDTEARLAGYCSAKGRLYATFVVWRLAKDDWLLACSADLLPSVLKRLSMFVLRAKCKLSDAGAQWALWGAVGPAGQAALGELAVGEPLQVSHATGCSAVRLSDAAQTARWLVAVEAGQELSGPALSEAQWRWLEVRSGVVRVVAATSEAFVPQMVNLELVGGVNFKKGCYPGQEVVARSQYRGTLKRRGALLRGEAALAAGQEIYHSGDPGQPAGTVALAAVDEAGRHWALAELKLAALADGTLHLGSAQGPALVIEALPYEIPVNEH